MNRLTVMILLLAFSGVVWAAGQLQLRPGMMGVADIGASDCAMFNEMHYNGPTGMRHHVLTWVQGYIYAKTGSNIDAMLATMPEDNGWNFDSLTDVFVDYCRANPDAQVSEAAIALWTTLRAGNSAPGGA
ncbi:MAG: hypothetical protein JSV45_08800 [Chromatiales bacterium]|nr:MAG: hypothetical protein JSV45_08800 [Chromatiales bacterium]